MLCIESSGFVAICRRLVAPSCSQSCNLQLASFEGTFPESRRFLNPECRRHPAALGESRHVRSTLALELLAATTLRVDRRNYLDLTDTTSTILASLMELEKKRP